MPAVDVRGWRLLFQLRSAGLSSFRLLLLLRSAALSPLLLRFRSPALNPWLRLLSQSLFLTLLLLLLQLMLLQLIAACRCLTSCRLALAHDGRRWH